ncbi:MAG: sulfate adenylyltransferase subunit CysN [Spirochaetaceae bacterium]
MSTLDNVSELTQQYLDRELLRFTTAGSVDDGKSTLIGRMLYDSKAIFQDQMEQLETTSQLRGEEEVNLALLTDGLRAEREQGITIDVAYRYFSTPKRKFIIADTPGHVQYTRNMVTGASTADLAVILIDARNGVITQSKRHGFIASLLGIPHVLVCVNKMDLVDYSKEVYDRIVADYTAFSEKLDVHDITFVPISALRGDNVVHKSENTPWYDGATVMHHLETVTIAADRNLVDFRFPVQYVVRPHQDYRGFAGMVVSGTVKKGEEIVALPSGMRSVVKEITTYDGELEEAFESQSVVLQLEDEIDVSRGEMICRRHNVPHVTQRIEATVSWMDEKNPLSLTGHYLLQHTTRVVKAYVSELLYEIDVNTMHRTPADTLELNQIGRVEIKTAEPLFVDSYKNNRATGSFILIDPVTNLTVAAGMIRTDTHDADEYIENMARQHRAEARAASAGEEPGAAPAARPAPVSEHITYETGEITLAEREARNGHKAAVVWFTGLSGSGKSTISRALEKKLFDSGMHVTRLDGDNVRHGLSSDLGFSIEDRRENIRRVAEAAKLLFESGQIVICSFISPFAEDRAFARSLLPEGRFVEVYTTADLDTLKARDPKGLYEKAERGEIPHFTGVTSPYEAPAEAEVVVDTATVGPEEGLERVLEAVRGIAEGVD